MEGSTFKIANLLTKDINDFYMSLTPQELDSILFSSSGQEINKFLSHLKENYIKELFKNLSPRALENIFKKIPESRVNKYLLLSSDDGLKRIFGSVSDETKIKLFKSLSATQRERLLNVLPIQQRTEWKSLIDEEKLIDNEYNTIISERISNSIEKDALDRLKNLELQLEFRQQQYQARIEQSEQQLSMIQQQINESERALIEQKKKNTEREKQYKIREIELKNKLNELKIEYDKQVQNKIEIKVPEYVTNAIEALKEKENEYKTKATEWSGNGQLALKYAVGSAIVALVYGAYEFNQTHEQNISWLFFAYLMLKGLIVIGLLGAWAKHAFVQSNAYMHEALKRSERIHAISFGKLYLEIYGNNVDKQEMKSIFENWNMESQSAFKEIKQDDFNPKALENVKDILSIVKETTSNTIEQVKKNSS